MSRVRVKGFQIFKDRHGKPRCYHRKTRAAVDLEKAPLGSAEFIAACEHITERLTAREPKPGTLGLIIREYRKHPAFQELAAVTKSDYQKVFNYLQPIEGTPLV